MQSLGPRNPFDSQPQTPAPLRAGETPAPLRAGETPAPLGAGETAAAFNLEDAVNRCFGKYSLFQDMAQCFLEEWSPLVASMRAAMGNGNAGELADTAHRLKGTLGYLGAPAAFEAVKAVEQAGRCADLAAAAPALDELQRQLALLERPLESHRRT